jgi:phage antirepressor YoqD-like protein
MIVDLLVLDNQVNSQRPKVNYYDKIYCIETNTEKSVKFFEYYKFIAVCKIYY